MVRLVCSERREILLSRRCRVNFFLYSPAVRPVLYLAFGSAIVLAPRHALRAQLFVVPFDRRSARH